MHNTRETRRKLAQPHRKAVLVALLCITAISGILFGIVNLQRANMPLALAELAMSAYSLFLLARVRRTAVLQRWIYAYSIPFFTTMMFALTTERATITVFGWVLLIPLLSHLLHGRRMGLAISVFYVGVAATIFLVKYHDAPALMQPAPILNMVILTLCL